MTATTGGPGITLACCGLLGVLVTDEGLIERSYAEAVATQGVFSGTSAFARAMSQVHQARGRAPAEVFRLLFPENEARAQAAQLGFERALPDAISRNVVQAAEGGPDVVSQLRADGSQVCVVTSLSRQVLDLVLEATGLRHQIDFALSSSEGLRGFPAPDLILTAALRAAVADVRDMAVIHGTGAGVEAGRRAGAGLVAGVLTGPHGPARLRAAGADQVIGTIADLPGLLQSASSPGAGNAGYLLTVEGSLPVAPSL